MQLLNQRIKRIRQVRQVYCRKLSPWPKQVNNKSQNKNKNKRCLQAHLNKHSWLMKIRQIRTLLKLKPPPPLRKTKSKNPRSRNKSRRKKTKMIRISKLSRFKTKEHPWLQPSRKLINTETCWPQQITPTTTCSSFCNNNLCKMSRLRS